MLVGLTRDGFNNQIESEVQLDISTVLPRDAILSGSRASSKKRLLKDISEHASRIYGLDCKIVCNALQAREELGSTAMGGGVAIPHARVDGLEGVRGIFVRLDTPFDFDASDRQPVDIVFALFAPENAGAEHLKVLARVSRILRDSDTRNKIRSTTQAEALFSILCHTGRAKAA